MNGTQVCYLSQTFSDVPSDQSWLSAGERARLAGFRFPKRRNDWVLGRWTAKNALRSFLIRSGHAAPDYSNIEILNAADGAPEPHLAGAGAPVALGLSHSEGRGFCVVAAGGIALGCDLESVKPRDDAFVRDYFCDAEIALVSSAPPGRQPLVATLIWCAKESALKCLRAGLRRDTRSVLVGLPDAGEPGWNPLTVLCRDSWRSFYGWWRDGGEYVETIAADVRLSRPVELPPPCGE